MTIHNELREQLDACRAGTDDLAAPELRQLAEAIACDTNFETELARSQQFDAEVAAALSDLPVPADLADRLVAATNAGSHEPIAALSPATSGGILIIKPQIGLTRRQWLIAGGSVALAALLATSVYWKQRPKRVIEREALAADVLEWMQRLPADGWQPAARLGIKVDRAITRLPVRWQRIAAGGWPTTVTAIDLAPSGGRQAILFVVSSSAAIKIPAAPTTTMELSLSGGLTATAWQRPGTGVAYILVVQEGQRLQDFLRSQAAA